MKSLPNPTQSTVVLGSFEAVSLPQLGIVDAIAKIDTGAYSGAVHCEMIEVKHRKTDDKAILRFTPSDNQHHVIEMENYTVKRVRSSNGIQVKRYIIETDIIIRNTRYTVDIGLSNRSNMQREVLIGRRFLRQNNMLVDVRINQELDNDSGEKL